MRLVLDKYALPILIIGLSLFIKYSIYHDILYQSDLELNPNHKIVLISVMLLGFLAEVSIMLVIVFLFSKALGSSSSLWEFVSFGIIGLILIVLFDFYVLLIDPDLLPYYDELKSGGTGIVYLRIQKYLGYSFYLWLCYAVYEKGNISILKAIASIGLPAIIYETITFVLS